MTGVRAPVDAPEPVLISIDWGTTSLRCWLVGRDGAVLDVVSAQRGILKTDGVAFGDILHEQIEPWLKLFRSGAAVPVIMSGMIGSQQGWREAPYVDAMVVGAMVRAEDLSSKLVDIGDPGPLGEAVDIRIVPGLAIAGNDELGQLPDVMRGEETQVLGALMREKVDAGVVVLQGTHSKWVTVSNNEIAGFDTYMTGEIYAALLDGTILGRLADGDKYDRAAFELGVGSARAAQDDGSAPGDFLRIVFSARTRVLVGGLPPDAVRSYFSGLLIGAEIASALVRCKGSAKQRRVPAFGYVLADEPLVSRYTVAAALLDFELRPAPPHPVPTAHLAIARLAGMVTS